MTTFLLVLLALLLIAALERTNRRQAPWAPRLSGSFDHEDRDSARTKLDLLALGDEPSTNDRNAPQGASQPGDDSPTKPTTLGRDFAGSAGETQQLERDELAELLS
jgi:hypothetical protein